MALMNLIEAEPVQELCASKSETSNKDLDTESVPPLSSDEPSDLPWLPDADDARWVEFDAPNEGDQWGSGPAAESSAIDFNPASAFETTSSMENESQTDREGQMWDSNGSGSETKRQRLSNGTFRRTSEVSLGSPVNSQPLYEFGRLDSGSKTELANMQDDDDHSSGDFQNQGYDDNEEDVIRALGMENVRRLASLTNGELADFEDSSSEDSRPADSGRSESTSDISSDNLPSRRFCTNCTDELDPGQTTCLECGHNQNADEDLLNHEGRLRRITDQSGSDLTFLAYDEAMLTHEEGRCSPHPERPDRLRAIISRLMTTGLAESQGNPMLDAASPSQVLIAGVAEKCKRIACREASREELLACHTRHHIEAVQAKALEAKASGEEIGRPQVYFSSDTYVRSTTFQCASLSAGGAVQATTAVVRGECKNAVAIIRPPGHHAESNMAMGFCFFNNAAVAARAAQKAGAEKVLIMDWDVHHGNGTQHIFEDDPSVLYMSIHRWDGGHFFPGTGGPSEVGRGPGAGRTVNIPWPTGNMGNGDYMAAFHHLVLPITYEFSPDLIIISAGFDAAIGDPLGGCRVTSEGFAHMTAMLTAIAPSVALLEGGYNLQATADGTEAMLRVLLGEQPPYLPNAGRVSPLTFPTIQAVVRRQAPYWACMRPFLDHLSFDPYASPFFNRCHSAKAFSPRSRFHSQDPLSPRRSEAESLGRQSSRDLGMHRSKLNAIRQQGKSQRKLALMHALHLVAIKHKLKASREVTQKLSRMPSISKSRAYSGFTVSSPTSPTKRCQGRDVQANSAARDDDPFMTQDSDSNDRNPFEIDHNLLSITD